MPFLSFEAQCSVHNEVTASPSLSHTRHEFFGNMKFQNCHVLKDVETSSWEIQDVEIRNGLVCGTEEANRSLDEPCIDLRGEYLLLPLFTLYLSDKCVSKELVYRNALDNGTRVVFDASCSVKSDLADQLGIWPILGRRIGHEGGDHGICKIIDSFAEASLFVPGVEASFMLIRATPAALKDSILSYDYTSTISAVLVNGKFHLARGEFQSFAARTTLDTYYLKSLPMASQAEATCDLLDSIESAIEDLKCKTGPF